MTLNDHLLNRTGINGFLVITLVLLAFNSPPGGRRSTLDEQLLSPDSAQFTLLGSQYMKPQYQAHRPIDTSSTT